MENGPFFHQGALFSRSVFTGRRDHKKTPEGFPRSTGEAESEIFTFFAGYFEHFLEFVSISFVDVGQNKQEFFDSSWFSLEIGAI